MCEYFINISQLPFSSLTRCCYGLRCCMSQQERQSSDAAIPSLSLRSNPQKHEGCRCAVVEHVCAKSVPSGGINRSIVLCKWLIIRILNLFNDERIHESTCWFLIKGTQVPYLIQLHHNFIFKFFFPAFFTCGQHGPWRNIYSQVFHSILPCGWDFGGNAQPSVRHCITTNKSHDLE